jgi:hypothetical protein
METVQNSETPKIPINFDDAFFPVHSEKNEFFYSWQECTKRFIVCVKWEYKEIPILKCDDKQGMNLLRQRDFGLKKRALP